MDKKEIEKEEKKREIRAISAYTMLFVLLTLGFAIVTIALAMSVGDWVFEAWGFIMFLLPLYPIVLWRKKVVEFLRERVEE